MLGSVPEAVLIAQLFLDPAEDVLYRQFLGDLEEAAAGFLREALQDFLAVGTLCLPSAATAHAAMMSAHAASAETAKSVVPVCLRIGEENRVHQRVRALSGFDGGRQSFLTGVIHAVGHDDKRLAA